ncbi:hypothetical protein KIK84_07735 [Curvibacter sp. CHRR-16]|uniref:hypothetical protein n=1 Tax=Curvibacter sp. CHRR-16 TaxID=2835872 RepID=UPI001BDAF211|nr:hypothetical protein [Curvibacter sp. CHRR-16]MBT0570212.1 hypothetical protein [Curvibacter sp. CHRR-16]
MKKLVVAAGIASAVLSNSAFAQAEKFAGFQLGASLDLVSARSEGTVTGNDTTSNQSSGNASLIAQFNFALGSEWILGLGGSYQLGENKAGNWNISGVTNTLKNLYSGYAVAGYAVDSNGLLYTKLAGLGADSYVTSSSSSTTSVTGRGIGIGYQGFIGTNTTFTTELMYNKYHEFTPKGSSNTVTPQSTVLSFIVAHKF